MHTNQRYWPPNSKGAFFGTPCIFECDRNEGEDAQENCSLFLTVWYLWEPNRQLILTGMMVMRQGLEIKIIKLWNNLSPKTPI